jgi:hypothetical protein
MCASADLTANIPPNRTLSVAMHTCGTVKGGSTPGYPLHRLVNRT